MAKSRKDSRGYVLRTGESQRKDGRYSYSYTDLDKKRDVTAIGHETFDTDPPFCKEQRYFQAECYVLKQDRYQIEMLTNLDKIPERGAIIFCIFVKQTNGTGFPVRCFAICPNK